MAAPDVAAIRQELATVATGDPAVELAAMVRMGGVWHRRGTTDGVVTTVAVTSPVGAVIRRVTTLAAAVGVPRPVLEMRAPGGVRATSTWGARLDAASLEPLGVVTSSGAPVGHLPRWRTDPVAALRAVVLVATSMSAPRRSPHLEIRLPTAGLADDVVALFDHFEVAVTHDAARDRVVGKSHDGIIAVLSAAGASRAAAAHAEQRRRRDLRNRATRLANADSANVARSIAAAQDQVGDLTRLRDAAGWETVPAHLREVALVRLANPSLSLEQLGQLCDPPVAKSTVHRRLKALRDLAADMLDSPSDPTAADD